MRARRKGLNLRCRSGYVASPDAPPDNRDTDAVLIVAIDNPLDSTGVGLAVDSAGVDSSGARLRIRIPAARKHAYFAYGSNLDEAEIAKTAPDVTFTKHADTRGGDAATITPDPSSVVWGYVYRVTDDDKKALQAREAGYHELPDATVQLLAANADPTPVRAFTFIAPDACPKHCGPSAGHLGLVIKGAIQRQLPPEYTRGLQATGERAQKD